jgi:hypothetical protein
MTPDHSSTRNWAPEESRGSAWDFRDEEKESYEKGAQMANEAITKAVETVRERRQE